MWLKERETGKQMLHIEERAFVGWGLGQVPLAHFALQKNNTGQEPKVMLVADVWRSLVYLQTRAIPTVGA